MSAEVSGRRRRRRLGRGVRAAAVGADRRGGVSRAAGKAVIGCKSPRMDG